MIHDFEVGQKVRLKEDIVDPPSGDSPGCVCGRKGDLVVIRELLSAKLDECIAVSNEDVTDRTFSVSPEEIYVSLLDT